METIKDKRRAKLNLWNIAKGYIDLNDGKLSNLDYLQMILNKELEIRARQKHIKLRKASKLPNKYELSFNKSVSKGNPSFLA
ncbi:MAG: hypothetical protein PHC44_07380 [Lutispora sp.]|nr:hypothetical protein [Lutispora sp.]